MESTKKRVGRPKSEPRTGPLVLAGAQKRETILSEVSADTAQELSDYASWVRDSAPTKMTPAEAVSKTIDFALQDVFARDKCWQQQKRAGQGTPGSGEPSSPATDRSPASPPAPQPASASVPLPPSGRDVRIGAAPHSPPPIGARDQKATG
jgi:hypothetical protein